MSSLGRPYASPQLSILSAFKFNFLHLSSAQAPSAGANDNWVTDAPPALLIVAPPSWSYPLGKMYRHYLDQIDAIIFDLDGVLLNTEDAYTKATRSVLKERADEFTWELKAKLMGRAPQSAAALLISELNLKLNTHQFLHQLNHELGLCFDHIEATPGAEAQVSLGLALPNGCAIATSSSRKHFEQKAQNCQFLKAIEIVCCSDDPQVKQAKPAPDAYLEAAKALNVQPQRCLVFEDSPTGVVAAQRAGIGRIIGVCHPQMKAELLSGCEFIIESFLDLPSRPIR